MANAKNTNRIFLFFNQLFFNFWGLFLFYFFGFWGRLKALNVSFW